MILSILIPTVPSRRAVVNTLLEKVDKMTKDYNDIEVICLYDNKSVTTGMKRRRLYDMAQGKYIQFIDDDDDISEEYIDAVYPSLINGDFDLITFNFRYSDNTGVDIVHTYGPDDRPNHTHIFKREVMNTPFEDEQVGEDRHWMDANYPKCQTRTNIDKLLYHYRYNTETTETQK